MFTYNCITDILKMKHKNLKFVNSHTISINNVDTICIYSVLSDRPEKCPHCGGKHINIHGYKESQIKLMPILGYNAIMKLNKQRYCCKSLRQALTNTVRKNCYIFNDIKHAAVLKAKEKISEKDIAKS